MASGSGRKGGLFTGFAEPHFGRRGLISGAAALGALSALAPDMGQAQTEKPQPGDDSGKLKGKRDKTLRMTTPIYINGQGPFDVIIDTGANRSVLSLELAAQLNLPHGAVTRVHGIAGVQDAPTANIDSFRAGVVDLPLRDVPLLARADLGADGFLGIDVFRNRRITFDFVRNLVHLERTRKSEITGSRLDTVTSPVSSIGGVLSSDTVVRAIQKSGQLTIVDASASGAHINCFIDSGAQRTVGNMAMRHLVRRLTDDRGHPPQSVQIHGATGQVVAGEFAFVPSMRIGQINLSNFSIAFADLHTFDLWGLQEIPALMIGMDLLSIFEMVSVDFGGRNVTFRLAELMLEDTARG